MNFKIFKDIVKKQAKSNPVGQTNPKESVTRINDNPTKFGNLANEPEIDDSDGMKNFITVSKTGYEDYGVYAGIMRDPTAKGGKRYMIMEPTLNQKDKENFEQIKKMLMVELSTDLNDIDSRAHAEERLKRKIVSMIDKYGLDIKRRDFL